MIYFFPSKPLQVLVTSDLCFSVQVFDDGYKVLIIFVALEKS